MSDFLILPDHVYLKIRFQSWRPYYELQLVFEPPPQSGRLRAFAIVEIPEPDLKPYLIEHLEFLIHKIEPYTY